MRVLLAVGDETISSTLQHHLKKNTFEVDNNEVLHRNYLEEYVSLYQPDMLIIHDSYLPTERVDKEEQEAEMLMILEKFRMQYGRNLRIVYLCIRDKNDSFLPQLVARDVLDIFNEMQIDLKAFVEQLGAPPTYLNVNRFGTGSLLIPARIVEVEEIDEPEEAAQTEHEQAAAKEEETTANSSNWMNTMKKPFQAIEMPKLSLPKRKTKSISETSDLKEMDIQQDTASLTEYENSHLRSSENLPTSKHDDIYEMDTEIQEEIKQDTSVEIPKVSEVAKPRVRRTDRKAAPTEKVKEVIKFMTIPFQIVVVGGLYPAAGTTTLASNLAIQLAKRGLGVGYLEYPRVEHPYIFDYLQIHSKDPEENYLDLGNELSNNTINMRGDRQFWSERGVTWSVNDTRKVPGKDYQFEDMLLHAQGLKSTVIVVDIGTRWQDEAVKRFLSIAEHILLVTDTDPVKLDRVHAGGDRYTTAPREVLNTLEDSRRPYKVVQMRSHEEMDKSMLKHVQHKRPIVSIRDIPFKDMQKALYRNEFIYENKEYQRQWEEDTYPLIREILPKEMWSTSKKKSLFSFMRS